MKKINRFVCVNLLLAMALTGTAFGSGAGPDDGKRTVKSVREEYPLLTQENTLADLLEHPAFKGFGHHLLTRDGDVAHKNIQLNAVRSLLPYHDHVDPDTVVGALNRMIEDAREGKKIFYDFYTEQQRQKDPTKNSTGLFFFRGKLGAPFAVICPGGGFSYVGSFHEGFPYAAELSKAGFNAFVLRYRVGDGGLSAAEDLAAAISFVFAQADSLGVARENYSLWGSSAGARMVAALGSGGVAAFGGDNLPKPSAVVMAYTGHSAFTKNDPPTFVTVGENDRIVSVPVVEKRIDGMRRLGIDVEYRKYKNIGHGFGLGTGTEAEGWIDNAIQFWGKYLKD